MQGVGGQVGLMESYLSCCHDMSDLILFKISRDNPTEPALSAPFIPPLPAGLSTNQRASGSDGRACQVVFPGARRAHRYPWTFAGLVEENMIQTQMEV